MVEKRKIENFLDILASYSLPNVFNPWVNNCQLSDSTESCNIRVRNLRAVMLMCHNGDADLWIGRDLGWRGGRRTGIPFVDEVALKAYGESIGLNSLSKATIDKPLKERTATEIDVARSRTSRRIFFWNAFPFHPHEPNKPFSNRNHTKSERLIGELVFKELLCIMSFQRIITIGNDARCIVKGFGIECENVRHPSYGGQKDFHSQINRKYNLETINNITQHDLFV